MEISLSDQGARNYGREGKKGCRKILVIVAFMELGEVGGLVT